MEWNTYVEWSNIHTYIQAASHGGTLSVFVLAPLTSQSGEQARTT